MIDPIAVHAKEVDQYREYVRTKYKGLSQLDRIEALMIDIFAMLYVGLIVMPNSNKEFI
jgi:hypothetical protein